MFKNDQGSQLLLTKGQIDLFNLLYTKQYPRVHVMAHTRYGKSLVIALAILMRVSTFAEKWAIVAPSEKKARIIMGYLIDHIFDNDYFRLKFQIGKDESLDRIRRERSKTRINFKHPDGTLGEVYILSADSRNKQNAGEALMGFGAANVVLDESSLIDDDIEAKIFRMLGDSMENFYCEVGNPFKRNHFLKSWKNPRYHKVNISWEEGMQEGRVNQDFIEEVRKKPFFDILYGNTFPEADTVDDKGWSFLILDKEYELALGKIERASWFGDRRLGVDIARGGGNANVWVLRTENYATVIAKNHDADLMSVVGTTIRLAEEYKVQGDAIYLDDTGVGAGVTDRMREQRLRVNAVKLGETASNETKFFNKRAENYWRMKEWLGNGGKLDSSNEWGEITEIKYKADGSSGRLKIMSKDEMRRIGIESPDTADALMLTFNRGVDQTIQKIKEDMIFEQAMREKKQRVSAFRMA